MDSNLCMSNSNSSMTNSKFDDFCLPVKAVHITFLNNSLYKDDIRQCCEKFVKVRGVKYTRDYHTFVVYFFHIWDAQQCVIHLNRKRINDSDLRVTIPMPSRSLWVGINNVCRSDILERFEQYGPIDRVEMLKYNSIIHFKDVESSRKALVYEQNSHYYDGRDYRILHVNFHHDCYQVQLSQDVSEPSTPSTSPEMSHENVSKNYESYSEDESSEVLAEKANQYESVDEYLDSDEFIRTTNKSKLFEKKRFPLHLFVIRMISYLKVKKVMSIESGISAK